MKVYIVFGSTGEYSDRKEWLVKAFYDEDKAKELVELASGRAREIYSERMDRYMPSRNEVNEYDPAFEMDYTGTSYYYGDVELE